MPTYIKSENLLYILSICNMAITLISLIRSNRKGMLNDTGSYVHIVQVLIFTTHFSRALYIVYNKSTKYLIIILDSYFIFIHVIIIHKIFFFSVNKLFKKNKNLLKPQYEIHHNTTNICFWHNRINSKSDCRLFFT